MPDGTATADWRRWLLREPSPFARSLLFVLPYSGTGASMYHRWPRYVGTIEVCPVQFPGRENRFAEPPPETYDGLGRDLAAALQPWLDRPFAFFAHCGSAYVGFEATRGLQERDGPAPAALFVSSMMAPDQCVESSILRLPDERLQPLVEELIRARGAEPLPELVEVALDVLRVDVRMHQRYVKDGPEPVTCPITVIGWTEDAQVAPDTLGGWACYGETRQVLLDGDHWAFLGAPAALLTTIEQTLLAATLPGAGHADISSEAV
jgi:surfactin synthase thioesterase subunit